MPRFVVLWHQTPDHHPRPDHWDLMLEDGGTLATWALAQPPRVPADIDAEPLPPHRLHYLDYEGPISDGRGHVSSWDTGRFEWEVHQPEHVRVVLRGQRLQARVTLTRQTLGWRCHFETTANSPEASP